MVILLLLLRSTYILVLFLAHIPFLVNRACDAAPTEQPQHRTLVEQQDMLIDQQNDSTAKALSNHTTFEEYWIHIYRLAS